MRLLAVLLAVVMVLPSLLIPGMAAEATGFKDVPQGSWYEDAVNYVSEKGYMTGVGEDKFAPNDEVTRAMFVTILARITMVETDASASAFTDVPANKWYTGAVTWAAENGVVNGVGSGSFAPGKSITRQDLCTILYRFVNAMDYELTVGEEKTFTDSASVSSYAAEAVRYASSVGLIAGYDDGTFRPKATATRAQMAVIIMRLARLLDGQIVKPEPMPAQSFNGAAGEDMTVAVNAPAGALPENTNMTVSRVTDEAKLASIAEKINGQVYAAADITFSKDGAELEPEKNVEVQISLDGLESIKNPTVVHVKDDGSLEYVAAEVVSATRGSEKALRFYSKDFSVYAVVDGDESDPATKSIKYEFYYGSTPYEYYNNLIKTYYQYVGEGETLYYPGTPAYSEVADGAVDPNAKFLGWYTKNNSAWGECVLDPNIHGESGRVITGITQTTTVQLYARYEKTYYIVYRDENNTVISTVTSDTPTATVKTGNKWAQEYSPMGDEGAQKTFLGWSTDSNAATTPTATIVGATVTIPDSGTLTLYPCIAAAKWINFDKNDWEYVVESDVSKAEYKQNASGEFEFVGKNNGGTHIRKGTGAVYVGPRPVQQGHMINADQPTLPVSSRPGYSFLGWWNGTTQWTDANGAYVGSVGNQQLSDDVTLTAHWEAETVNYTVIVWKQQITDTVDDEKNDTEQYDVEFAVTRTAKTGEEVSVPDEYRSIANGEKVTVGTTTYDFTGFHHDNVTPRDNLTGKVKADGSLTLNVYYNRNIVTINFFNSATPTYSTDANGDYYYYQDNTGYYLVGTGPLADMEPKDFSSLRYGGTVSSNGISGYTDLENNDPTKYYSSTDYTSYTGSYTSTQLATAISNAVQNSKGYWYELDGGKYYPLYYSYRADSGYYAVGTGPQMNVIPSGGDQVLFFQDIAYNGANFNLSSDGYAYLSDSNSDYVYTYNPTTISGPNSYGYYYFVYSNTYYPIYYHYTNRTGYYHVGAGPDPTAPGTHNLDTSSGKSYVGLYEQEFTDWDDSYLWFDSAGDTYLIFLGAYKLPNNADTVINLTRESLGSTQSNVAFYLETVEEEGAFTPKVDFDIATNMGSFTITDKFPGFTARYYRRAVSGTTNWNNVAWTDVTGPDTNGNYDKVTMREGTSSYTYYDLKVYFKRNSYTITYMDSETGAQLGSMETNRYEADLTGKGTADATTTPYNGLPAAPAYEGKFFTGWYADATCTTKVFFNDPTEAQLAAALKVATDDQKNSDGTLKYTVYEQVPMKNLILYAGYNPIRFRVWIQPNGGEMSATESTYFNTNWGEIVERYNDIETSRNYYPDANGTYYYIIFDHENPRRTFYTDNISQNFSYVNGNGETVTITPEQLQSHAEKKDGNYVKYISLPNAYAFYGWYEVVGKEMGHYDGTGNGLPPVIDDLDEENGYLTPYIFGTPTQHDTAIRAIWRRAGSIQVNFDTTDKSDTEIGSTGYCYADRSECVAPAAPEVKQDYPGYYFVGWRTPSGELVQPNDVFLVLADQSTRKPQTNANAAPEFDFYVTAVYQRNSELTTLTYDVNAPEGFTPSSSTLTDGGCAMTQDNQTIAETSFSDNLLSNIPLNSKIKLSDGSGFTCPGYELIGWNDDKTEANKGNVKFELGGTYGIGEATTLYAVWKIAHFFVYHSATGKLEAVEMPTKFVVDSTDENGIVHGHIAEDYYDITSLVTDGYLYGGYYSSFGGVDPKEVDRLAAAYNAPAIGGWTAATRWTRGETAEFNIAGYEGEDYSFQYAAYTGESRKNGDKYFWESGNAITTNGKTSFKPESGEVYYLKEVSNKFLTLKYVYVYDELDGNNTDGFKIKNFFLFTLVDDNLYANIGFRMLDNSTSMYDAMATSVTTKSSLSKSYTVSQRSSENNPNPIVVKIEGNTFDVEGGYVATLHKDDLVNKNFAIVPTWVTKDGVTVGNVPQSLEVPQVHKGEGSNVKATPLNGFVGTEKLYVNVEGVLISSNNETDVWEDANAVTKFCFSGDGDNKAWSTARKVKGHIYCATVPAGNWTEVKIVRCKPDTEYKAMDESWSDALGKSRNIELVPNSNYIYSFVTDQRTDKTPEWKTYNPDE